MPPSPLQARTPRTTLAALILLAAAIACLLDLALHRMLFAELSQDQAWLLYAAGRLLHGTQLYGPRLVETNPPLIIWLSTLPAVLATHLHLQPLLVLQWLVSSLIVLSSLWSLRILRRADILRNHLTTLATFAFLLVAQTWMDPVDFGQREHLLVLLLLPYLLASLFSSTNTLSLAERLALGIAASVGICIKPQQVLILLGTELFLALWYRQLRRLWCPELLALILTGLAYIAAVRLFTPLYFTQIVPLLLDTYWAFRPFSASWVMLHGLAYDVLLPAALLLWLLCRRALRYPVAPITLLVASLFASFAFALQHADWVYQAIPRKAFLLAAIFWLAAELFAAPIARLQPERHLRLLFTTMLLVVALPAALFLTQQYRHSHTPHPSSFEQQILSRYPPGTIVYQLSTNSFGIQDVLRDHLLWGGRYVHLWMLPAIVFNEAGGPPAAVTLPPARVQQLANLLRSNVATDLHTFTPAVVLVERCSPTHPCQALNSLAFNTLAWFQRDPAFAAEWTHYHLSASSPEFDVYARTHP